MKIPEYYPHCGACDEYGHQIPCELCIAGDRCLDSSCRVEDGEEDEEAATRSPCRHRLEIIDPACLVRSGTPRGVCAPYAP